MKKKVLTAMLAGVLSISMVVPAFATNSVSEGGANPASDGTKVMAGIMLEDPDAKIQVDVPTLFAFVVNGSVDSNDTGAVTFENGGIMLPNVKVNVTNASKEVGIAAGGADFEIETVGEGKMIFTNYSTKKNKEHKENDDKAPRVGLDVKISGFIENKGDAKSRNYWEHVADAALVGSEPLKGNDKTFKKYTISIDGKKFNDAKEGGFAMEESIDLVKPDLGWKWDSTANSGSGAGSFANMNETSKLAEVGSAKTTIFNVEVGGQRNQYKQVEQSAKVGTIVWTISAEVHTEGVYTAPNNEYLDGVKSGDATDPDSGIELNKTP